MSHAPALFSKMMRKTAHYLTNALIVSVIKLALTMPYAVRMRSVGWLVQYIIGPIARHRKRALNDMAKYAR